MATNSTADPVPPATTSPTVIPTPTVSPSPPPTSTTTSTTSTSNSPPQTSSSNTPAPPQTSSSNTPPPGTTPPPGNTPKPDEPAEPSTFTDTNGSVVVVTETRTKPPPGVPTVPPSPSDSSTSLPGGTKPNGTSSGGLSNGGKIAIAVVVPIAAIAILVVLGIFFYRKRKQRKDVEEQRRKEVEDYGYNPNADPTIPAVAMTGGDGASGYRGWGTTTLAGSTAGRKTSTTMSGGAAYSDAASPTRGTVSDTRSGEPLMNDVPPSPEGEILGVMGPSASNNRGDVHRGPSNASSSYSAAARSDGSGDGPIGVAYGGPNAYYDQYGSGNPYSDNRPAEGGGQPVIRDVAARRNTQIQSPAQYNQQTAGISQNF
ncbi:transmembrane alpha-helix domain-protein [Podospora fimiseda]|uniref:Transmembrane alpha-helix domain-protein n=1 Tax=Podospora fimiseda TaxID=252190 RepID=A0AAN7BS14_9PEZI|nr:transmembrane alpha-helix domain-protein [Podospora fimiseda]